MRLKSLFFPLVLLISVAVFIGFIWPEIKTVREKIDEKNTKSLELQSIKKLQEQIQVAGEKFSSDSAKEAVVNSYLPESKVEERIISGINYLSSDANVALVNLSVASSEKTPAVVAQTAALADPNATPEQAAAAMAPAVNAMEFIEVEISVSGEYDKLRIFLDGLERMPIFNTIESLKIEKMVAPEKEGEVTESNVLIADLIVNFGYLKAAKVSKANTIDFKPEVDEKTIAALQEYISTKSQPSGESNPSKGKQNPFLAN